MQLILDAWKQANKIGFDFDNKSPPVLYFNSFHTVYLAN
jgi:hypothetical protein